MADANSITGHWISVDECNNGVIGYSIIPDQSDSVKYAVYGKCHPSWSVSNFNATLVCDGFEGEADYGFKKETVTGTVQEDGTLLVVVDKVFTDDSGRAAQHSEDTYRRVEGTLSAIEEALTQTFYEPSGEPGGFDSSEKAELEAQGFNCTVAVAQLE